MDQEWVQCYPMNLQASYAPHLVIDDVLALLGKLVTPILDIL